MEFLGRSVLFLDVVLFLVLVYFWVFRTSLAFPFACILALFIFKKVTAVRRSLIAVRILVQKRSENEKKDDDLVLPTDYIVIDLANIEEKLKGGSGPKSGGKIKNVCTNGSCLEFETRTTPHVNLFDDKYFKAEEEKASTSQGTSETIFKNEVPIEEYSYCSSESWGGKGSYKGQFFKGLWHGFGEYRAENGDRYAGTWRYGLKDGTGQQYSSDGALYNGEFKNGVKHGLGWTKHMHGDWYAGEHEKGEMHGFGAYHFFNGDVYEGMWNNGDMHGSGYYKLDSGESKSGIWEHNVLRESMPESHPHINRIIEVQDTVTEAEKAAAVI